MPKKRPAEINEEKTKVVLSSHNDGDMSRADAFSYLGLDENVGEYQLDNRFWQLTKQYRAKGDELALDRLSRAYMVASGRMEKEKKEKQQHLLAKKHFGKTKAEWQNHFYYEWWKYIVVTLAVVIITYVGVQMLFGNNYDLIVVAGGDYHMDNLYLEQYVITSTAFDNPQIAFSSFGQKEEDEYAPIGNPYAEMTIGVLIASGPDVLIFDEVNMHNYIPDMAPLDYLYEELAAYYPMTVAEHVEPVYSSMANYYDLTSETDDDMYVSDEDREQKIYGLRMTDPQWLQALGFFDLREDREISVVFCLGRQPRNDDAGRQFLMDLFSDRAGAMQNYRSIGHPHFFSDENKGYIVLD